MNAATILQQQNAFFTQLVAKLQALANRGGGGSGSFPMSVRYTSETTSLFRAIITGQVIMQPCTLANGGLRLVGTDLTLNSGVGVLQGKRVAFGSVTTVGAGYVDVTLHSHSPNHLTDGVAHYSRLPHLYCNESAPSIASGFLENVEGFQLQALDLFFDANSRASTTFSLSFPREAYWQPPVIAARQNLDTQVVFGATYTRAYPTADTQQLRIANLSVVAATASVQLRW